MEKAELVSWYINDDHVYCEEYTYRGNTYIICPDSEVPVELQHMYEQQTIDLFIEADEEEKRSKKTLVIHPYDRSTLFLKKIYENKGFTVFDGLSEITEDLHVTLHKLIDEHDRIIMLGHGSSNGLFNTLRYRHPGKFHAYLIDDSFADQLKNKETISVWCHSDKFFKLNGIRNNTLHTGMIISELSEQLYVLGGLYLDEEQQLENMERFSEIIGECLDMKPNDMRDYILEHYTGDDKVTEFNRENIIIC
mgnify:CR=1 FL=1